MSRTQQLSRRMDVGSQAESGRVMYHKETVVIVAHPDDEVLWFASVLPRADKVVMAFGPLRDEPHLGQARDKAVTQLPFPSVFLRLEEAASFAKADWNSPAENAAGVELVKAGPDVRRAYEANYVALRDCLQGLLHAGQAVFSHNPWGEYGHEDHVLVYRAVESLRREIGFQHWVPAYVSDRSVRLAQSWREKLGQRSASAAIDRSFTASVEAVYQRHSCWTWDSNWSWPSEEWFYQMSDYCEHRRCLGEVQLINVVRSPAVAD